MIFEPGHSTAESESYFSPDYATARDRFRDAARRAGASLEALVLETRGPLREDERWEGAPALYPRLDPLLNPPSPPDLDWLRRNLAPASHLFALDFHTGLGRSGQTTLIREPGAGAMPAPALGHRLVDPAAGQTVFRIRGGMGGALTQVVPGARIEFVLQEVGTYPAIAVLQALRAENRSHHYGGASPRHPAKLALLEALSPASATWRRRAVVHGLTLLHAAAAWTFRK